MKKTTKLVKDLIKSKRESVMGKLGDSPFEDPMEPWSVKYNSPVKEEILLEVSSLLQKYIRSLGYNPDIMDKSELMKYARSKEFAHYALDHSEIMRNEGIVLEAGTGLLMTYIKTKGVDPTLMDTNQKNLYSKSSEFRIFKRKHNMRKIKEISGMGERGDDWNEEKKTVKEAVDEKDTVTMDIPLLIRVLEFIREDVKTDMDLHRVVENLIDLRTEGVLTMNHYDRAVKIKAMKEEVEQIDELKKMPDNMDADDHITREDLRKWFSKTDPQGDWKRINSKGEVVGPCAREPGEPKPKCMSKEKRAKLSKSERAAAVAAKRRHDPDPERKGKPINVSNFGKGKLGEEIEHLEEKNKPTNPSLWARAKAMARSKFDVYPSAYANGWASKWYKSKGGGWKSVKEETVSEGLGNKEDSPLSANDSVKAMESTHRNRQLRSARIIKSIYKNKMKKESLYDWEKDDKGGKTPNAKMILKGGKTMTGKDRDIVEIEPVLRTRPNNVGMNKPTV